MNILWENFFKKNQSQRTLANIISENYIFQDLTRREVSLLLKTVHVRKYRPSEAIFKQGEAGVGMYIVVEGNVDIHVDESSLNNPVLDENNQQVFITRLKSGDFFGEMALVENSPQRSATAIACGETQLIGFFKPDLNDIIERSPSTGVKIIYRLCEVLGRRLRETSTKVSELKRHIDRSKGT